MTSEQRAAAMRRRLAAAGCVAMALGVGLGAFGAHGLRARLSADLLAIYQTGVLYHLVHGLAAILATTLPGPFTRARTIAATLFLAGIALFSGSLYVLAVFGVRGLGAITPLGGLAWLAAWTLLAWSMVAATDTSVTPKP